MIGKKKLINGNMFMAFHDRPEFEQTEDQNDPDSILYVGQRSYIERDEILTRRFCGWNWDYRYDKAAPYSGRDTFTTLRKSFEFDMIYCMVMLTKDSKQQEIDVKQVLKDQEERERARNEEREQMIRRIRSNEGPRYSNAWVAPQPRPQSRDLTVEQQEEVQRLMNEAEVAIQRRPGESLSTWRSRVSRARRQARDEYMHNLNMQPQVVDIPVPQWHHGGTPYIASEQLRDYVASIPVPRIVTLDMPGGGIEITATRPFDVRTEPSDYFEAPSPPTPLDSGSVETYIYQGDLSHPEARAFVNYDSEGRPDVPIARFGQTLTSHDGRRWRSIVNMQGVCRWMEEF